MFLLQEVEKIVAPISDSPKPPPQRITMTYPVLNNAKAILFASCGAGKAEILKVILISSLLFLTKHWKSMPYYGIA